MHSKKFFLQKSLITSLCLCILFITGCGYQKFTVPALESQGLPSDEVMAQYNVDKNWWIHYNDEQLNTLLEIALANNIDMLDAISTLKRAFISIRYDEGNFIPSGSGSASVSANNDLGGNSSSFDYSTLQGNLSLGLSLDLSFWKNLPTLDAAKWSARASAEDMQSVRLTIAYGLIDSYFTLMYYHQVHSLILENITFLETVLKTTQYQHTLGSIDDLEPLTAKQALNSAKEELIASEININDTLVLIRNYLNINHSDELLIHPVNIMRIKTLPPDLNVPLETLSLRPDIRQAEYLAYSALYNLKSTHRAWVPSISIGSTLSSSGTFSHESINPSFLNSNSFDLGGVINISLPFLSWWNIKWTVKEYENYMQSSLDSFTAKINQALNEVQALYFSYENETKLFELAREKTGIDRGIFDYRRVLYEEGRDDLKTWLEANTDMNNSRENLLLAKLRLIRKENNMYKSMGGRILTKEQKALEKQENNPYINRNALRSNSSIVRRNNSRPAIGVNQEDEKQRAEERASQKIDGTFRRPSRD